MTRELEKAFVKLQRECPKPWYRIWVCPECGVELVWSYDDLACRGNPVCGCDTEMEMAARVANNEQNLPK